MVGNTPPQCRKVQKKLLGATVQSPGIDDMPGENPAEIPAIGESKDLHFRKKSTIAIFSLRNLLYLTWDTTPRKLMEWNLCEARSSSKQWKASWWAMVTLWAAESMPGPSKSQLAKSMLPKLIQRSLKWRISIPASKNSTQLQVPRKDIVYMSGILAISMQKLAVKQ